VDTLRLLPGVTRDPRTIVRRGRMRMREEEAEPSRRAGEAHVVGARVDWLEVSFRCELDESRKSLLRAQGAIAVRQDAPGVVALGEGVAPMGYGAPGLRVYKLVPPKGPGKWWLENALMRVEVCERGPGCPEDSTIGWTVRVIMSGTALLAMGWRGAIREAWAVAWELGVIHEGRCGRTDLCCDVANYDLRPDDRHSFVKSRRLTWGDNTHEGTPVVRKTKTRTADGGERSSESLFWQGALFGRTKVDDDGGTRACFVGAETFTGFCFGLSRKAVSARIYDKVLQLRTPPKKRREIDSDKRRAEFAEWRRNGWAGMDDEPEVTRVEFQICGEPLEELGLRCPTRPEERREDGVSGADLHAERFALALDPAWKYLTAVEAGGWLRLARRGSPDVAQPRWRAVQAVTFERAAMPKKRERSRGHVKAAQALGAQLSLLGSTGELFEPWIDRRTGEGINASADDWNRDPGERVSSYFADVPQERVDAEAAECLRANLRSLGHRAGERIAKAEIERAGGGRAALERVWQKWGAALARTHAPGAGESVVSLAVA
jgi:hypothetical protein